MTIRMIAGPIHASGAARLRNLREDLAGLRERPEAGGVAVGDRDDVIDFLISVGATVEVFGWCLIGARTPRR
jgi:hypothetical protein